MSEPYRIAMLGPSGAGKTSLLVSMFTQFAALGDLTGLTLSAHDTKTSIELNKYRTDLEAIARQLVVREPGIVGTRAVRDHTFRLSVQADESQYIDLRFTDYPGGWLLDAVKADDPELVSALEDSDVLVLAVDAPSLLAERGRWHHLINAPQRMRDIVARWASKPGKLLILVPLKCEAWVEEHAEALNLARTVESAYNDLISTVAPGAGQPAVVIAPVQTVGSLVFDGYEMFGEVPVSRFRGRQPNGRFAPKWTAEPLRYVVRHLIQEQQDPRSWFQQVTDWAFGGGHELRVALEKLGRESLGPSVVVR